MVLIFSLCVLKSMRLGLSSRVGVITITVLFVSFLAYAILCFVIACGYYAVQFSVLVDSVCIGLPRKE